MTVRVDSLIAHVENEAIKSVSVAAGSSEDPFKLGENTEKLSLQGNAMQSNKITEEMIARIQSCRKLTDLDLSYCKFSSTDFINAIKGLPLQRLTLMGTDVEDACFADFARVCPTLTYLDVKKCNITDRTIQHLVSTHKKLKEVDATGCHKIGPVMARRISNLFPHVRIVDRDGKSFGKPKSDNSDILKVTSSLDQLNLSSFTSSIKPKQFGKNVEVVESKAPSQSGSATEKQLEDEILDDQSFRSISTDSLEYLKIVGCKITPSFFEKLKTLKSLTRLIIECSESKEYDLLSSIAECPNLQVLVIQKYDTTPHTVAQFLFACKSLQMLSIQQCARVSEERIRNSFSKLSIEQQEKLLDKVEIVP